MKRRRGARPRTKPVIWPSHHWVYDHLPNEIPMSWFVIGKLQGQNIADGVAFKIKGGWAAMVTGATEEDGCRWIHISLSHAHRIPTWPELVNIRDTVLGSDALCVQVLAPDSEHVNLHRHCLHLWHCLDRRVVPDFRRGRDAI